ncbi:hypothetical protein ACVI1J_004753 [Bradyrhizobium diazoefficiens]
MAHTRETTIVRLTFNPLQIQFEGPLGACCFMISVLGVLAAVLQRVL